MVVASRGSAFLKAVTWLLSSVVRGQICFSWFGLRAHFFDSLAVRILASGSADTELFRSQHFLGYWRPVRETPHYKLATGTIEEAPDAGSSYDEYMMNRRSRTPQDLRRKSSNFLDMIAKIRIGSEMPPVVVQLKPGFLGIIDGTHRLATYAALCDVDDWNGRVSFVLAIGGARQGAL